MKKAKKEKKEKIIKPDGPINFNRSIMAAFEKQSRGKICPLCETKFSLASYKSHMNTCNVADDDEEIEVIATYTRDEAILMRAGPEIILGDASFSDKSENPTKRRKTDEREVPSEDDIVPEVPGPSGIVKNHEMPSESLDVTEISENIEKVIKKSPEWINHRRRSSRLLQNSQKDQADNANKEDPVKKETATISEVLQAIERFEQRVSGPEQTWPYYIKITIKIMKRVISTEKFDGTFYADDFWLPSDIITFYRFVELLSEGAKCLLVRLFIRKPAWYNLEKLEQKYPEIPNIKEAVSELAKGHFIDDDSSMKTLDEALQISDVVALKNVTKKFKLDGTKNRQELIQSLRKFAQSQQSIFGGTGNVEKSILKSLKQELGPCVRVRGGFVDLFKCLFTIYCPVTTNSANVIDNPSTTNVYQDLLYLMLSVANGTVQFPAPNPCPIIASFYKNRNMLQDYMISKSLEIAIVSQMSNGNLDAALDLAIDAKEFIEQMSDDDKRYYESLEIHERKFTSIWVFTRCCGHASSILERQKKYGMAVEWQKDLLITNKDIQSYCIDSRGIWWDRMLLNLDSHLKEKKECAKMIQIALQDPSILEKELLMIQDRALKLKEMPADFVTPINIGNPEKKTITANVITKSLGDGRINRFMIRDHETDDDVECSVEEVTRRHYLENEGFSTGVHDEGSTWHTLFGLFFYDVIFATDESVESTWLSELQDCPSDLSNTLYSKRKEKFEDRFVWLEEAEQELIEENIRKIWDLKHNETNRECSWKQFPMGAEDCVSFFQCIPRPALILILRRLAENYRNSRSGFPDLTLWNPETKRVAVVEVKGPGDRLSTKQRLWLAIFADSGIRAEVCHVAAQNSRLLV